MGRLRGRPAAGKEQEFEGGSSGLGLGDRGSGVGVGWWFCTWEQKDWLSGPDLAALRLVALKNVPLASGCPQESGSSNGHCP